MSAAGSTHEKTPEVHERPSENALKNVENLQRQFPAIADLVSAHKEVLTQNRKLEETAREAEKSLAVLQTSWGWLRNLAIIVGGGLCAAAVLFWVRAESLDKAKDELIKSRSSVQRDLYDTKLLLFRKEVELMTYKNGTK